MTRNITIEKLGGIFFLTSPPINVSKGTILWWTVSSSKHSSSRHFPFLFFSSSPLLMMKISKFNAAVSSRSPFAPAHPRFMSPYSSFSLLTPLQSPTNPHPFPSTLNFRILFLNFLIFFWYWRLFAPWFVGQVRGKFSITVRDVDWAQKCRVSWIFYQ